MSASDTDWLTPAAMANECEISIDTLRYYEREGLLDEVARTAGGQRRYRPDDVAWVNVLRCLRVTALPIKDMRRFAEFVRRGDEGIAERVELLATHRLSVVAQMQALGEALEMIDHKIEVYTEHLEATPTVAMGQNPASPTLGGKGARAN